ncbi:hypothetical protein ACIQXQ_20210 [Peribacillus sp. NPDC097198]|uniref:hypothetical protein n=1 Tax=Peribacillus sp. NPDC097198 TaxID=3364397 RepID=UPI0037F96657
MKRYNQFESVKRVSELLSDNKYNPSRVNNRCNDEADIILSHDKKIKILVRHLEKDHAYKNSPLPYKVYKVEAFDTNEERDIGVRNLDFVIGYNFNDDCFACIPISEYIDKRSVVIHEKEDTRHEFFNSLMSLEKVLK